MDAVVGKILQLSNPQKPDDYYILESYLCKHEETIHKNDKAWSGAIQALCSEGGRCTMGILWIASVRSQYKEENPIQGTVQIVEELIKNGDYKQMYGFEITMKLWGILIRNYARLCRAMDLFRRGILYMAKASAKFAPDHTTLTPAHQCLVFLALKGNNLKIALPLLQRPIFEVNTDATGVNVTDYMKYYLYGALVFLGLKKYKEAEHFLEIVLSTPAQATSAIMIEAFKVYLLLGIISKGKVFGLPTNSCNSLERATRQLCSEYAEFAAVCETMDHDKINKCLMENRAVFISDGMIGLALQASGSIVKQNIHALTKTYITLNIKQMAQQVGVTEQAVSGILLDMVEEGTLNVQISLTDGKVSFLDEKKDDISALENRLSQLSHLANRIESLDEVISLSEPYVTEKLRNMPNYRELLQEFEVKRKASRGVMEKMTDFFTQ